MPFMCGRSKIKCLQVLLLYQKNLQAFFDFLLSAEIQTGCCCLVRTLPGKSYNPMQGKRVTFHPCFLHFLKTIENLFNFHQFPPINIL